MNPPALVIDHDEHVGPEPAKLRSRRLEIAAGTLPLPQC